MQRPAAAKGYLACFLVACGLAACSASDEHPSVATGPIADAIYSNATVWTGASSAGNASAIAIADGRILKVGSDADMESYRGATTRIVDLDGKFVTPGFIDNHTHFLTGSFGLASVDLRDAATPQEFAERIGEFAKTVPQGRWIREGDWDHELWGGELPQRSWVDAVTENHPVFVSRLDGHMAFANGLAIELAGITAATPDPDGGEIVRDADGEPSGVFKDTAMDLILNTIPPRSDEEFDAALAAGVSHALSQGVTQIHDMSLGEWDSLAAFRRAHVGGNLDLRVYAFLPLADWAQVAELVAEAGRGDEWLRWGGLKGMVDGSLGSTTAWFYDPYDDEPDKTGLVLQDTDELKSWLKGADKAGLQVTIHAIGDRANDWLLDAFAETIQENGDVTETASDRRFRVEHAQHLSSAAIDRFASLGVIASMQPYHAIDDGRWAEKRIGPERIKTTYAFRSLIDADAVVTFGSDWTVAPMSPLAGIYAAVTRRTTDGRNPDGWVPAEKITAEEALRAYTSANAYAGYQEDDLGTLVAGKLADFVVLSENILTIEPGRIADVDVLRTVIGGEDKFIAED